MDNTPSLGLPYIMAAQSQKHVTHNEAIRALDAVVQLAVLDRDLAAPPVSPTEGDRYIVAANPTGDWDGQAEKIAAFQDGAWAFLTPNEGWIAWIADEEAAVVWSNSSWTALTAGGSEDGNFTTVGINATADATNRLSLASTATLFNHEGAGHQFKINKAADSDTASLLYQTAFSGRAEMGTAGDDDFHFKVSPDGSTWKEAILINSSTGVVTFPFTAFAGLVWRGAWATSTSYAVNDAVENDGSSYVCRQAHTSGSDNDEPGVGANTATYWELFAAKGAQGPSGSLDFASVTADTPVSSDTIVFGDVSDSENTNKAPIAEILAAGNALTDSDIGSSVQAYSSILDNTTASFTTAEETKLDGIETGATADQSASELLAALLTVDGSASGLDADTLDGNHADAFALSSHAHAASDITSGVFASARIAQANVTQHQAAIDHDALTNFVASKHVDHTGVSINAGSGLTGGGAIDSTRTLNVGAGAGIVVNADDVAVDINGLTEEPGLGSGDFLMFWDTSAGALRKVDHDDLPGGSALVWQGTWVTATPYGVDDITENNGSSYICILAHTSGSNADEPGVGANSATYWGLLAAKGADAMNYSEDDLISGFNVTAMTDTSDTEIIAAQGVGQRIYVTQITVHNAHASVDTGVAIKDGATEIYRVPASSVYGGATLNFSAPLRLSDNAALQAACLITGASVHVSASGFKKAA